MAALDRDAVAEVLLKHRVHFAYGKEAACHCGASVLIPGMGGDLEDPLWTTHQADAIVELVRPVSEVKAEAVRAAAAAIREDRGASSWIVAWLNGYADELRSVGAG